MGKINNPPNFLKKLLFLQRHSSKVLVLPGGICSKSISIELPNLCDCTFGVDSKELLELVKHNVEFQLESCYLVYSFVQNIGLQDAVVAKRIPLETLDFPFCFEKPVCTIKLPVFRPISSEETRITFIQGKLILETNEYIKTRLVFDVRRLEGLDCFTAKVKGKDLRIIEEIEGDRVLCFFENNVVVFGFEKDSTTGVVVTPT